MTPSKSNQRKSARVEFAVSVDVETDSLLQTYHSKNLSLGGIFLEIRTPVVPQIDSILHLTFDIPGREKDLQVKGKVIYHHKYESMDAETGEMSEVNGVGLSFVDLSEEHQKLIEEYIQGKELHVDR